MVYNVDFVIYFCWIYRCVGRRGGGFRERVRGLGYWWVLLFCEVNILVRNTVSLSGRLVFCVDFGFEILLERGS